MSSNRFLLIILGTVLLTSACSQNQDSIVTTSPGILSHVQNGLEVQLVAAYRDGEHLWATLCYEQPSGQNWIPGWHPNDVSVAIAGNSYPMSSLELIGFQSSQDGIATHRCDRFRFLVPKPPQSEAYHLVIERLVGERATSADCPEVQHRLDTDDTGIKIECLPDAEGFFSFGLLERPDDMTDLEASYIVDDHAGEVVAGPWEFSFQVVALGE
ncbi:MAG: hypothetical protein MUP44_13190 [Anaerolineales bacterium]|nr:hypothetical protein [Anaerolineales bacterium]